MHAKTISIVFLILIGTFILASLIVSDAIEPATASEPTPTPVTPSSDTPDDTLCHLANDKDCTFINPLDAARSNITPRLNPAIGARNVPTYTLISIRFDNALDTDTLNPETFSVAGDDTVDGTIIYVDAGHMAIFQPNHPLRPGSLYTATVSGNIQDVSGQPVTETRVWTFTTTSGYSSTPLEISALNGMNIYFGDLHSHTGYSDGQGTPADAFTMARASGLDFFGLTEHAFMLNDVEWQDVLYQADALTTNGQFVALPGFEYSHGSKGHINVFGSNTYVHRDDPNYDTLPEFYTWLINQPTAIGQFNHPGDRGTNNFDNFAYNPAVDHKMVLQELTTAYQFFLSTNSGWHLGTLKNRDTHIANWGCCPLMGAIAPNLTQESILAALAAKRTFFVSPSDSNFALVMQANGYWMGSAIPHQGPVNFTITAHDPNPKGLPLYLYLYDNGVRVAGTTLPGNSLYTWAFQTPGTLGHYYYAEAYYPGWLYPAYSSPIWVERSPLADAGAAQTVASDSLVTLNGGQSSDPDGRTLLYQWAQESGPAVTINQANTAYPTFTAPNGSGDLTFRLTVTDPGSLIGFDTTSVTVTNNPILAITKTGPSTTGLGEPVSYTLTITNSGLADAIGLVVTDAVPVGATHLEGGTLMPGRVVSWTLPALAGNGGTTQVTFAVIAARGIINDNYRASCLDCVPAAGNVAVFTNIDQIFLPIITKNQQ